MSVLKLLVPILLFSILIISCGEKAAENKTSGENSNIESPVSQNSYESYLTAADIEKVSGLPGVKLTPKDPKKGAGGDLNFATSDDKMIVMVQIVDKSYYAGFKEFFKGDIEGLGVEAMHGATLPNYPENNVSFVKGNKCVALTTFINMNDLSKNMLTIEQTTELARIIAARM
jgi:hypothetical protein